MENNKSSLESIWKNNYSEKIKDSQPSQLYNDFSYMSRLLSVGKSYNYILNLKNCEIGSFKGDTKDLLGIGTKDVSLEHIAGMIFPESYAHFLKKEKLVSHFRFNKINFQDVANYKVVHFFELKDFRGNKRRIMHQTIPLSVNSDGVVQQILGVHTDVTHFNLIKDKSVSFVHLKDGTSYRNVDPDLGFLPHAVEQKINNQVANILTPREIHICRLIAVGLTSNDISDQLKITTNTVYTHRRKILKKSNCRNSAELIHKFFTV